MKTITGEYVIIPKDGSLIRENGKDVAVDAFGEKTILENCIVQSQEFLEEHFKQGRW